MTPKKCVILVGHGGVPKDCPPELIGEFKRLEAQSKGKPSPQLAEADAKIRRWPRTPQNDPYKAGLEALAQALRSELKEHAVSEAYNEFCAPSLVEAVETAVAMGSYQITVISTMYTRGGVHSENEIPEILQELQRKHPGIDIRYVWPFDLKAVASMLAGEIRRTESQPILRP